MTAKQLHWDDGIDFSIVERLLEVGDEVEVVDSSHILVDGRILTFEECEAVLARRKP